MQYTAMLFMDKPGAIIIEGHVQGIANTRALGRAGIPVIVVDKDNCIARYSKYCKGYFKCPDYKTEEFAQFLIELATREGLNGWSLIPSNDHAVYTISKYKQELSGHFKVITPDIGIVDNIYKKHRLLALAKKVGVPIPATWDPLTTKDINLGTYSYPAMIKGREGLTFYKATGRKVFLAQNKADLLHTIDVFPNAISLTDTFVQEVIPSGANNKTISFTAFCINGEIKTHWTGIKLREHPAKFGTATFTESIENNEVYKHSKILLKELKYTGVCEVEYLFDHRSEEYKLIEINARTWLWVGLAIACGVNYPLIIHNYLNGIEPEYPSDYRTGLKWINIITDLAYSVRSLFSGKLSLNSYMKSINGKKVRAIFDGRDVLPGIMFLLLIPYMVLKR